MIALFKSKSSRAARSVRLLGLLAAASLGWGHSSLAAGITNLTVVNVTPSSFGVVWMSTPATPSIDVFADPSGATNLIGQLGSEAFPLQTGSPTIAAGYFRRQGLTALRQKARSYGLMMLRVTGCQPGHTYYYRVTSTPSAGAPSVSPASGPLPSVTTELESAFVANAQQLIIDVPGVDTSGQIVTLTHPSASYPLAAVVGDGASGNQVVFNVNDLFSLVTHAHLTPMGAQQFTGTVLSANGSGANRAFALFFTADFTVAQGTLATFGTEFLALTVGSTNLLAGESGQVPIDFNSSAGVVSLDLALQIPAGHLTNLSLRNLAAEIDPASVSITPNTGATCLVHLATQTGQSLLGVKQLGQLAFTSLSNAPSAFVPLTVAGLAAAKADLLLVTNLFAQSGRIAVVAQAPLLEETVLGDGTRQLTLYGQPWSSYQIDFSSDPNNPGGWQSWFHFPVTNRVTFLGTRSGDQGGASYRAVDFKPDPPVLDAFLSGNQGHGLLVYGLPGSQYTLRSAPNLSGGVIWNPVQTYTLTNSFLYLSLPTGSGPVFYRLQKM